MKKETTLKELLSLASKDDLKSFVTQYAKGDKVFSKELTSFLAEKYLDEEDGAEDLIEQLEDAFMSTRIYGGRWDSYEVTDWDEIVSEADQVYQSACHLLEIGNASAALLVALTLFELADKEDLGNIDESDDWAIVEMLDKYGKLLVECLSSQNLSQKDKDEAIDELKKMVNSDLEDYGLADMHKLLHEATIVSLSEESQLLLLNDMIQKSNGDVGMAKYVKQKIELLEKMGRKQEATDTIQQHILMEEIRKYELQRLLNESDYEKALSLTKESQRIASENRKYGVEEEWMRTELDIHTCMGNKEKQLQLCRQLFIRRNGSMDYYQQLKQLVSPEKWKSFLKQLLSQTKMSAMFSSSIEADIYVAEQDEQSLFNLLMDKSHHTLDMFDKYAMYLKNSLSSELLTEYIIMVKEYASQNMGAKHYYRIRQAMEAMLKLENGPEAVSQLATYLRENYRRRPSLLAEIKKF